MNWVITIFLKVYTRRSSCISTKKQNKEEIQHSQQLQNSQTLLTKLNKSCKDKKEEQKRKNRDDYHNRKRKIVDNVDKEINISKRKTKYQKLVHQITLKTQTILVVKK